MLKKVFVTMALLGAAGMASAANVTMNGATAVSPCGGGSAAKATITQAGTPQYTKSALTIACSANVNMSIAETDSMAYAVAGSTKGKSIFGGNTDGGAVKVVDSTTCGSDGCSAGDVSGKIDLGKSS